MEKQFQIIILILFSFILNYCSDSTSSSPKDEIIPLHVGNQWIRTITNYDTLGNIHSSRNDTIFVEVDTTINGEKWYKHFTAGWAKNKEGGYFVYQNYNDTESLFFKYPANINDTYFYMNSTPVQVIDTNKNIITNMGNFNCYQYRTGNHQIGYSDYYISPNIGIILKESFNPLASGNGIYKYLSYETIDYSVFTDK